MGQTRVRLSEVLGALSHALDLVQGQPKGHCTRSCWIGINIGHVLGLDETEMFDLYYAILLKDTGCSSNAARISSHFKTDDRTFKRDIKAVSHGASAMATFLLGQTGRGSDVFARVRALLAVAREGSTVTTSLIDARCQRGAQIARQLRFSPAVADGIQNLDEHWDGQGLPLGLRGDEIPRIAQIALLAQVVDVFTTTHGETAARRELYKRQGRWFSPHLVTAFEAAATDPAFWEIHRSPDVAAYVLDLEPARRSIVADEEFLDDIASAFAEVIDAKSPFTHGHSSRVAGYAAAMAGELGHTSQQCRMIRRASLLHDIGKLGISNTILDKPGRLDQDEYAAVKEHAGNGREILERIDAFAQAADIAGSHHERLDGQGYPCGRDRDRLSPDIRIVTVADVFDAMTAERPYRSALPVATALQTLTDGIGTAFDPTCVAALQRALDTSPALRPAA